ncbi:MAG TPA: SDR family oxidoreductase [Conexibacter sp.]|nr:SDR family oxidoreductase [Conexibacter sp.]
MALVTGAASGIGRATALRLATVTGRTVVAVDLDGAGLEQTAEAVREAGGRCVAEVADVTSSDACEQAVAAALAHGPLEVLVNAAGVMTAPDSAEHVTDAQVRKVLDVNVGAVFRLSRGAIPAMRARGGGAIVNVASVHAYASVQDNAVYAASKGALVALTRQMALDAAADGIRVVAVAPGAVDTPMARHELARRGSSFEDAGFPAGDCAIGRVAQPEEVAEVIAWLASSGAAIVNGTTVVADAGLLARLT